MAIRLIDEDEQFTITDLELMGSDGDKDTAYTLRQVSTDTQDAYTKKFTKESFDRKTHMRVKEIDGLALADALIDYVLVDWTGVIFKGQPVPCTLTFKKRLDAARRTLMLERAGVNQRTEEAKTPAETFREPEGVRAVVAGSSER